MPKDCKGAGRGTVICQDLARIRPVVKAPAGITSYLALSRISLSGQPQSGQLLSSFAVGNSPVGACIVQIVSVLAAHSIVIWEGARCGVIPARASTQGQNQYSKFVARTLTPACTL